MKLIEKYGLYILITVAVIIISIVFIILLCVGIAKDVWQWALYGII